MPLTPAQFAAAIALVESGGISASWGDDGRAMGAFQAHPDWVSTWARRNQCYAQVGDTWDAWVCRIIMAEYERRIAVMDEVGVAMWYHLGHTSLAGGAGWDRAYAARFAAARARVLAAAQQPPSGGHEEV